jgi:hypothetical protein
MSGTKFDKHKINAIFCRLIYVFKNFEQIISNLNIQKQHLMKKQNLFFAFLLMASLPFITSCAKDEKVATPPTLMLNAAPGYTATDVTVPAGTPIKAGIIAQSKGAKLTKLEVITTINGTQSTIYDTTFSSDSYNAAYNFKSAAQAGIVKFTFKISAADGESAEASIIITTTAGSIKTYSQKILGSYDAAIGSSFASADGVVYSLPDAKANASKIDWMYYYGSATSLATLVAPIDATASSVFSGANGPASWSTKNDTKLAKVTLPSGVTWDNITTDAEIIPLASGLTETKVNLLAVGQIVSFKTITGKMGLIKIEAITGTAAGNITYSVKVQQ